jgi:hypothetical protein
MRYQEKTSARGRLRFRWLLLTAALVVSWSQEATADTIRAVNSSLDALASTAAIVEGNVTAHAYTYDTAAGPRIVATLTDVTTHFGRYGDRTLQVATLGGPISTTRMLFVPELPRLTEDTRYLIFLTNSAWFYSPVVENYIFRVELNGRGTEVLIAPTGHAVVGVSAEGLELSIDPVVDTQIEFLTPNAKLRLIDSAPLADAMSKQDFLAAIQDLARTVPLQGDFRTSPASDRVWDRMTTVEETSTRSSS